VRGRAPVRVNVKTSSVVEGGGVAKSPQCVIPPPRFDPSFLPLVSSLFTSPVGTIVIYPISAYRGMKFRLIRFPHSSGCNILNSGNPKIILSHRSHVGSVVIRRVISDLRFLGWTKRK
jgi:hypothetical protein